MSEANKAIQRRAYEEMWSTGDVDLVDELYAENFVLYDPITPDVRGPEGYKAYFHQMRSAFPDLVFSVEDQIAEGDKVATRWKATATHGGEIMGIPATGKKGVVQGITISRIVDGKIVEERTEMDALGMLRLIGAIPPMD
jgi:steroid delta-isomerase-like uncharacterized protein